MRGGGVSGSEYRWLAMVVGLDVEEACGPGRATAHDPLTAGYRWSMLAIGTIRPSARCAKESSLEIQSPNEVDRLRIGNAFG